MKLIKFASLILLILSLFLISSVSAEDKESEKTLTIGNMWEIPSIDPAQEGDTLTEKSLIAETLVAVDQGYIVKPWLAESWSQIDDKTWEFKLRDDVFFHDGSKMTANDVKFSLEREIKEDSTLNSFLNLDQIEVVDEKTVRMYTKEPNSILPAALHWPSAGIISPKSLNEKGEFVSPIGTGPFKLESYDPQTQVLIVSKNDKWWGGEAKLNKVIIKPISDPNARALALENGEIDLTFDFPYSEVDRINSQDGLSAEKYQTSYIYRVDLNLKHSPMDDIRVRHALSYAVNRDDIVKYVLFGVGAPAKGPFNSDMPWTNQSIEAYSFSLEKAKQLLDEAGWKDENGDGVLEKQGKTLELSLLTYPNRPGLPPIAESLAGQLKEIGVKTDLEVVEWGAITDRRKSGDWDMILMATNTAAVPDPYYYLTRSYQTGGANNYVNYSNPALDSMLNKSLATLDTNTRYGILEEVQSIAQNEATNIVVAYYGMVAAYNDHVKGFKYDPTAHDYRLSPEMYIEK